MKNIIVALFIGIFSVSAFAELELVRKGGQFLVGGWEERVVYNPGNGECTKEREGGNIIGRWSDNEEGGYLECQALYTAVRVKSEIGKCKSRTKVLREGGDIIGSWKESIQLTSDCVCKHVSSSSSNPFSSAVEEKGISFGNCLQFLNNEDREKIHKFAY
jgi:hypothetical protein